MTTLELTRAAEKVDIYQDAEGKTSYVTCDNSHPFVRYQLRITVESRVWNEDAGRSLKDDNMFCDNLFKYMKGNYRGVFVKAALPGHPNALMKHLLTLYKGKMFEVRLFKFEKD